MSIEGRLHFLGERALQDRYVQKIVEKIRQEKILTTVPFKEMPATRPLSSTFTTLSSSPTPENLNTRSVDLYSAFLIDEGWAQRQKHWGYYGKGRVKRIHALLQENAMRLRPMADSSSSNAYQVIRGNPSQSSYTLSFGSHSLQEYLEHSGFVYDIMKRSQVVATAAQPRPRPRPLQQVVLETSWPTLPKNPSLDQVRTLLDEFDSTWQGVYTALIQEADSSLGANR